MIKIPEVTIRIESRPTTDHYLRAHAKAVDGTLDNSGRWQETQREYFIGFYRGAFTHEQKVNLRAGRHSVEYASSGYVPNYAWHAKIYVNNILIAEGDVGREANTHLRGYFAIGPLGIKPLRIPGILPTMVPPIMAPSLATQVTKAPTKITLIKTY